MSVWTDNHPRYCKSCGAAVGKSKHYCPNCKPVHKRGQHRPKEKVCEWCGMAFRAECSSARFCSLTCANKANGPKTAERNRRRRKTFSCSLVWASCLICGKQYIRRGQLRACSAVCADEGRRRRRTVVDAKRKTPRQFKCEECGVAVETEYGDKRRRFCSGECCSRHNSRVSKPNARAKRRLRKSAGFVASVSKSAIWKRDHGRCQLCGEKIDRRHRAPHPLALSLDHIVPLSKGGTHEPANVQLAHFGCNSRKSDGVGPQGNQLRLLG